MSATGLSWLTFHFTWLNLRGPKPKNVKEVFHIFFLMFAWQITFRWSKAKDFVCSSFDDWPAPAWIMHKIFPHVKILVLIVWPVKFCQRNDKIELGRYDQVMQMIFLFHIFFTSFFFFFTRQADPSNNEWNITSGLIYGSSLAVCA